MLTPNRNRSQSIPHPLMFLALVAGIFFVAVGTASAQTDPYLEKIGRPDFDVSASVENGTVSLTNGNLHLELPIASFPERAGHTGTVKLVYDSRIWTTLAGVPGTSGWGYYPATPYGTNGGWRVVYSGALSSDTCNNLPFLGDNNITVNCTGVSYNSEQLTCTNDGDNYINYITFNNFTFQTADGMSKSFNINTTEGTPGVADCTGGDQPNNTVYAGDGSGYYMVVTGYTNSIVYDNKGNQVGGYQVWTGKDTNGNGLYITPFSGDSLGRSPVTITTNGNVTYYDVLNPVSPRGSRSRFTVTWTTINVNTGFGATIQGLGQSPIAEYTGSISVVQSLTLPNGQTFTFGHDSGTSVGHFGSLTSMTLPTGAQVNFGYSTFFDATCSTNLWVTSHTSLGNTSTYTPSVITKGYGCGAGFNNSWTQSNNVLYPDGSSMLYQFSNGFNTSALHYDASHNLMETELKEYTTVTNGNGQTFSSPLPFRLTTTLPMGSGSISKKIEYYYDDPFLYGDVTEVREWSFYPTGSFPAAPDRTTDASYTAADPGYLAANILNLPTSVILKDGSGAVAAQTNFTYDGAQPACTTGVTGHDDTNYHCTSSNLRGNVTQISRWLNTTNTWLNSQNTYDDLGNLLSATDPNQNTTTHSYADNFTDGVNHHSNAYLTQTTFPVVNGVNHIDRWQYDFDTGLLTASCGENFTGSVCAAGLSIPQSDYVSHTYDTMARLLATTRGDGGEDTLSYNDTSLPLSAISTTKINLSQNLVTTTALDGLGRTSQTQLNSAPGGVIYTDTTYDSMGRVHSVSNPHLFASGPTDGVTTTSYDALGRITLVTQQDGGQTTTSYSGNSTTVTDPAGKQRRSFTDGFGRLIEVDEPVSNSLTSPAVTLYSYNAQDDLICVVQKGTDTTAFTNCASASGTWRPRKFVYDSLSRMTSVTNPESGTISYAYDADGNLLTKTDARGITATMTYDALDRLLSKTYSDGTPTETFSYDQNSAMGNALANAIGRLIYSHTPNNSTASLFSYDPNGRVAKHWQCVPRTCGYELDYIYNLAGAVTSQPTGTGIYLTQSFDSAGRVTQITSSWVDENHPATLVSGITYSPVSALAQATYGNSLSETHAYNNVLQPCRININSSSAALHACTDAIPTSNVLDLNAGFAAGSADNGSVVSLAAFGQQSFSRSYTYDGLNRLATMSAPGDQCSGLSWNYDVWGNRTAQNNTGGSCVSPQTPVYANNRLMTPYGYDAAGNVTYDGVHHYFYDAENRLIQVDGTLGTCSAATACYVYDAADQRVEKITAASITEFLYDEEGQVITEIGPSNAPSANYIRMSGEFIAEYENNATYFVHRDHLGSTRLVTNLNASTAECDDYLPFGELIPCGSTAITTHKFTGKQRGSETASSPGGTDGLDDSTSRFYQEAIGRFISPDGPLAGQHPDDPQSWNLYSYVRNNPINGVDPDGHDCIYAQDSTTNEGRHTLAVRPGTCNAGDGGIFVQGTITYAHYNENTKDLSVAVSDNGAIRSVDLGTVPLRGDNSGFQDGLFSAVARGAESAGNFLDTPRRWYNAEQAWAARHPAIMTIGAIAGGFLVGGGDEMPDGEFNDYIDVTNPRSRFPNRQTNLTPSEFGANLEADGFSKTIKGNVRSYTKGKFQYDVYPTADSTGGPSAQVKINGVVVSKIRLK